MVVVLIAMVGLSVDVGNTFSQERRAVSASNAAAVAAMTTYLKHSASYNITDGMVYDSIVQSMAANGIVAGDGTNGTVNLSAYYLSVTGDPLPGRPTIALGRGQPVPSDVAFIQVKVDGKVDTSFARVVGQNNLPINATSHAGVCPVNSGIYPLAIDSGVITSNQFNSIGATTTGANPEYKLLTSGKYAGYYQRRVYLKDGSAGTGNALWLRWTQGATSESDIATSLAGSGNIDKGFKEASWPSGTTAPAGYPVQPDSLSIGDWIWGNPGWKDANTKAAALDQHIANTTSMILPIFDGSEMKGANPNVEVRVVRLGAFVLINRSTDNSYLDMVFLGTPVLQYTACTVTPPPPASNNLYLFGNVTFYPEYQIVPIQRDPVQYVVVLDESGSMSANFDGKCSATANVVPPSPIATEANQLQCANGPSSAGPVTVTGTGPNYYWKTESERRIYVAKNALKRLIGLTNMPGNTSSPYYDPTRPPDQMGVVWFTQTVQTAPSSNIMGLSSTPGTLTSFIMNANSGNGTYRSEGGTNGAAGLYAAKQMYAGASIPPP